MADQGQGGDVFRDARSAASVISPAKSVLPGGATEPADIVAGVATRVQVAAAANTVFNLYQKLLKTNGFASVVNIPHEQPLTITHHDVQKVIDSIKEALAGVIPASGHVRVIFGMPWGVTCATLLRFCARLPLS